MNNILCSESYLKKTITNLVINAAEATGSGISSDDMEHIFEPFYTKKKFGHSGTGLGLTAARPTRKSRNFVLIRKH